MRIALFRRRPSSVSGKTLAADARLVTGKALAAGTGFVSGKALAAGEEY